MSNQTSSKWVTACSMAVMTLASSMIIPTGAQSVAFARTTSASDASSLSTQASAAQSAADKATAQAKVKANVAERLAVIAKTDGSKAAKANAAVRKAIAREKAHPKSAVFAKQAATLRIQAHAAVVVAARAHAAANRASVQAKAAQEAASQATARAKTLATEAAAAKASAATTQTYKDGTYTGVGQTQIGAVQVQLTLKADKITNVQITGYSTHYPISYIDPVLPDELMQRQDINQIDVVSGATLSTEDFYYAVQDCLQQAKKAQNA